MEPSVGSRPTRRAALCHEAWGAVCGSDFVLLLDAK
jgi:hypothetical protein